MSEREVPSPEDCPEPFWHDTHRYCPACSWAETPDAAPASPPSNLISRDAAEAAIYQLASEELGRRLIAALAERDAALAELDNQRTRDE